MKEEIIIVDENDNIVRYCKRDEKKQHDIHRVAALWIWKHDGRALMAKRSLSKKNDPSMWGPAVAGTVDKGESYEDNIRKEMEEEIGLKDVNLKLGPKMLIKTENPHITQWFFLTLDKNVSDFKIQKEEVDEVRWFTKKEFEEETKKIRSDLHKKMKKYFDLF